MFGITDTDPVLTKEGGTLFYVWVFGRCPNDRLSCRHRAILSVFAFPITLVDLFNIFTRQDRTFPPSCLSAQR